MYRRTHQCGKDSRSTGILSNTSLFASELHDEQNLFKNQSFFGLTPSISITDEPFLKDFESVDDLRFDPTDFSQLEDILLPLQSEKFFSNIFWEFDENPTQGILSNSPSTNISVSNITLSRSIPDVDHDTSEYQNASIDSIFNESTDSFSGITPINRFLDSFCIDTTLIGSNNYSDSLRDNLFNPQECDNSIHYCRKSSPLDGDSQTLISLSTGNKPGRKPKPLSLTEDEKSILKKEGVVLPENVHTLTKTEERHIKQVKRRIKNKISAAESRKRKKYYLDGLEERVQQTTSLNCELQKRVSELEKRNLDLLTTVKRMKSFLSSYVPKIPTSNSALLLFIIAFSLFSIPSWISISNNLSQTHYSNQKHANVGSRTLLSQSFSNSQWIPFLRVDNDMLTSDNMKTFSQFQTEENLLNLKSKINAVTKGRYKTNFT